MPRRARLPIAVLALACAVPPSSAMADNGGISAPGRPAVEAVGCSTSQNCWRGAELQITGESLQTVTAVRFLGSRGKRDDRVARPAAAAEGQVRVTVPARARSGPVEVVASTGRARGPRLTISAPPESADGSVPAEQVPADGIFPIRGAHDYGTFVNSFGGGRGHQGQDVLARCGTPLVAALAGTVIQATSQSRAGNYVVVQTAGGASYAYLHMAAAALVEKGDRVRAGQRLGDVGSTGRSSACHLHFEWWTAPGWYRGGKPVDPLPNLKRWER